MKREKAITGESYHVFSRSISKFNIFNNEGEFRRMRQLLRYNKLAKQPCRYSQFLKLKEVEVKGFDSCFATIAADSEKLVEIVAYCLMPNHFHLILNQLMEEGITAFMSKLLNGYSRYFNTKIKRNGPLWEKRFEKVMIKTDEQLLHLTRYIHLNPVTAYLVEKPEQWPASSYLEYLSMNDNGNSICDLKSLLDVDADDYKKFVEDGIDYQRNLAKMKKLFID